MNLQKYIDVKKIKQIEFAALIGVSPAFINQICKGARRPSADVALQIEKATNGKVTVLDVLYPDREAA